MQAGPQSWAAVGSSSSRATESGSASVEPRVFTCCVSLNHCLPSQALFLSLSFWGRRLEPSGTSPKMEVRMLKVQSGHREAIISETEAGAVGQWGSAPAREPAS